MSRRGIQILFCICICICSCILWTDEGTLASCELFQMLIQYVKSNSFPQNESSDGDSSSSTYGQIKTFESFFEVKITIRSFDEKYLQVFMLKVLGHKSGGAD